MAVIQKDMVVPDYLIPKIMDGSIDLMGLAKNSENGQIVKHLETIDPRNNDFSAALGIVILVTGAAALGVALGFWIHGRVNNKSIKRFTEALNTYINAVKNKELTTEIIDDLVNALDKLKGRARKNIQISFSNDELTDLIECLCYHTQTLANDNNINLKLVETEEEKTDLLLRFRNNLVKQKAIFELAA